MITFQISSSRHIKFNSSLKHRSQKSNFRITVSEVKEFDFHIIKNPKIENKISILKKKLRFMRINFARDLTPEQKTSDKLKLLNPQDTSQFKEKLKLSSANK
jgi:hypothetical protein